MVWLDKKSNTCWLTQRPPCSIYSLSLRMSMYVSADINPDCWKWIFQGWIFENIVVSIQCSSLTHDHISIWIRSYINMLACAIMLTNMSPSPKQYFFNRSPHHLTRSVQTNHQKVYQVKERPAWLMNSSQNQWRMEKR